MNQKFKMLMLGAMTLAGMVLAAPTNSNAATNNCYGASFQEVTGTLVKFRIADSNSMQVTISGQADVFIVQNNSSNLSLLLMAADNPTLKLSFNYGGSISALCGLGIGQ